MKKILIIDDDEIFAKLLADSLPKDKYVVTHVGNGEDGLKALEKDRPDVMILDLIMPKMGGMQFLEALKKKGGNNVPILISSQLSKIKDVSDGVVAGIEVGVKGYIIKSSENMEMIINTIKKTIGE